MRVVRRALRELEIQFVEMSQAEARHGKAASRDTWANAASQVASRSQDDEWINAVIQASGEKK